MNKSIFYILGSFLLVILCTTTLIKVIGSHTGNPASVLNNIPTKKFPYGRENIVQPTLSAENAFSVLIEKTPTGTYTEKILFEKNPDQRVAIASVTKLVTAGTVNLTYQPETLIKISTEAVAQPEQAGQLIVGETYRPNELLFPLLIESSNDAAYAFAEQVTYSKFITAMNTFAQQAGMASSTFANPSGLDKPGPNLSTARDIAKLGAYIATKHPDLLRITATAKYNFTTTAGVNKSLSSTNNLLSDTSLPFAILGGKTGETRLAKQALVIITDSPIANSFMVHVVLRSDNRESDMRTLIQWVRDSYFWTKDDVSAKPKPVDPLTTLQWVPATTSAPWTERDAHSIAVFKDMMYLIGGVFGNGIVTKNGVVEYWNAPHGSDIWTTPDGLSWTQQTNNAPWKNRRSVGTVVFQNKLWLMGGWSQYDYKYDNRIWWTEDGLKWNLATSTAARWPGREGHTLNVYNGKIYLIGGVDFVKRITYNDVWESSDGINWTEVTSNANWSPRYDHAVSIFDGKLYLTGGLHINTHQTEGEVWISTDGKNWEKRTPQWPSRHGHISLTFKDALWVIGGWHEGKGAENKGINDTWFTRDGINWTKTKTDGPWLGREDHMGEVFKNTMWVTGGMDTNEHWSNDVYYAKFEQ